MRRVALAVLLLVAACSTNRRLAAIDARLAAMEKAEQARAAEQQKTLRAMQRQQAQDAERERVERKLDELAKDVAELDDKIDAVAVKAAERKRRPEPKGTDVYAVPIDGSPVDGPADALVTIVRGYEYACPYCEKSRDTMTELRKQYPDDVRIVYRAFIVHPQVATLPAEAACAAHLQGQFVEMDRRLWDEAFMTRKFDQENMEAIAKEVGLDMDRFRDDMSNTCPAIVAAEMDSLKKVGQGATPTFFINGRYLAGALPVDAFAVVVDEEIELAKKRLKKKGGKKARAKYYAKYVLGQGQAEFTPPP